MLLLHICSPLSLLPSDKVSQSKHYYNPWQCIPLQQIWMPCNLHKVCGEHAVLSWDSNLQNDILTVVGRSRSKNVETRICKDFIFIKIASRCFVAEVKTRGWSSPMEIIEDGRALHLVKKHFKQTLASRSHLLHWQMASTCGIWIFIWCWSIFQVWHLKNSANH